MPRGVSTKRRAKAKTSNPRAPRKADRAVEEARAERPLLGGLQQRLVAPPPRPGYTQRIVNDERGKLAAVQQSGYNFVTDPNESEQDGRAAGIRYEVGTNEDGSPKHAYLMEKPLKWHEEDQARKQAIVDARESAIFDAEVPEFDGSVKGSDKRRFYTKTADHDA